MRCFALLLVDIFIPHISWVFHSYNQSSVLEYIKNLLSKIKYFKLKNNAGIQICYTNFDIGEKNSEHYFEIKHTRLYFLGYTFKKNHIDCASLPKILHLYLAQFKLPFSIQQITSNGL